MTTPASEAAPESARFRERLRVPVRWWALLALLLCSLWLALLVSTYPLVLWSATAVAVALGAGLLLGYGAARVEVTDRALLAGRARLTWASCGAGTRATALDAEATRLLRGVDADARAFLLLRPYVATAVRVDLDDPTDPTPYWLLSTRHPRQLAESINAARGRDTVTSRTTR